LITLEIPPTDPPPAPEPEEEPQSTPPPEEEEEELVAQSDPITDHEEVVFERSQDIESPSPIKSAVSPRRQAAVVPQSPVLADFTADEEVDRAAEPEESLAVRFRELGEGVIARYWYPVDTPIPRLKKNSQVMVTFQPNRYNRVKQAMAVDFKKREERAKPMITFRRVVE
jgi:hypothetical protein